MQYFFVRIALIGLCIEMEQGHNPPLSIYGERAGFHEEASTNTNEIKVLEGSCGLFAEKCLMNRRFSGTDLSAGMNGEPGGE